MLELILLDTTNVTESFFWEKVAGACMFIVVLLFNTFQGYKTKKEAEEREKIQDELNEIKQELKEKEKNLDVSFDKITALYTEINTAVGGLGKDYVELLGKLTGKINAVKNESEKNTDSLSELKSNLSEITKTVTEIDKEFGIIKDRINREE